MTDFKVITPDFVKLHISTSKDDISFNEKRFPKDLTISDLKGKLELITGGNCNTMQIEVYDKDNKLVCTLAENNALLGSFPLEDGMRLHVIDKFCIRNELDYGDVEKFECSEEEYSKKSDSVRAFLMKNKFGKIFKFKGKTYFECPANYGAFVKPYNVECGDFPEEDYDLNEEI
ncbi:tubulin-folding cofactor B [Asbolus verrucosus]|uniref:Tubulin-folding cofactor B n=1 Tax=Asbolus verrucosus TaxID=1661398 RepID=A0A482VUJ9_ASBVE|nr:tubulin-folding cofactor B [Asbolus verrucosus]